MAEDRKRDQASVPPGEKPGAPQDRGEYTAAGLIRKAWSAREADGMHEVNIRGQDIVPPRESVGVSVARGDVGPMPRLRRPGSKESRARGARPEDAPPAPEPGKRR